MSSCTKRLKKLSLDSIGQASWQAPSNIALVKYWGKKEVQIPCNPSVSFTLKNCHTKTSIEWKPRKATIDNFQYSFLFEGKEAPDFHSKIDQFFEKLIEFIPELHSYEFKISSENSFPHSAGIASSASAMAALSLCLVSFEREMGLDLSEDQFYNRASFFARLGSGSACRSLYPEVACWGESEVIGNDLFALPFSQQLNEVFRNYQDSVVIVDSGVKSVSSRAGHALMNDHPFAMTRFEQASLNYRKCLEILKVGDLNSFINLVENEALTLHAMMMTSRENYMLMKPGTLEVIEKLRLYRSESNIPLCFTLDAGPNVHILYPKKHEEAVKKWISENISFKVIHDELGEGPINL
ncbi:MAG: diphosphomevalonate decarboxylase [Oligoflexia bacterium]|nr:diphosphomevalonate decarboxylase [Oligoflexia bacterium]